MSEILALLFVVAVVVGFLFYLGWYRLQNVLGEVRESGAALQLVLRTKLQLTQQAMDACQSRADQEKLVALRISTDLTGSFKELAKANARAEQALAYCTQLATRFPELKTEGRFGQLHSQLEQLGNQLDTRHAQYNTHVDTYNLARTTHPTAIVARALKFPEAPNLNLRNWMIYFTPQK